MGFKVEETGLREKSDALIRYSGLVEAGVTRALREIGEDTKTIAQLVAQTQGLDGTGKYSHSRDPHPGALIKKIRVAAGKNHVAIISYTTSHSKRYPDYSYQRLYEYRRGRPFMRPARDAEEPLIPNHIRLVLREARDMAGLGDA